MNYLDNLTADKITNDNLPLTEILANSYYYPACAFDGQLVKHAPNDVVNFVYCDYAKDEVALLRNLQNHRFNGYSILGQRSIKQEELVPNGWQPQLPPNFSTTAYAEIRNNARTPFAKWLVFQRQAGFDDTHGPMKFSLLYVGGEGVATYQALYWTNQIVPKAVAIIQAHGFAGNWTDFIDTDGHLFWVLHNNPSGVTNMIYYGGVGNGYRNEFRWPYYEFGYLINSYYQDNTGEATVWRRK